MWHTKGNFLPAFNLLFPGTLSGVEMYCVVWASTLITCSVLVKTQQTTHCLKQVSANHPALLSVKANATEKDTSHITSVLIKFCCNSI